MNVWKPNFKTFQCNSIKIPARIFTDKNKFILKFIWEGMGPQIPGRILRAKWEKCPTQSRGLLYGSGARGRRVGRGTGGQGHGGPQQTHPTSSPLILDKCEKAR